MFKLKHLVAIMLSTLMLFSFAATAKDKKEKDKTFKVTGEAPLGGGYKVNFNEDKSSYLKVWGMARMYWYHNINGARLRQPYFRFYIDGQKEKKYQIHARLDYNNSFAVARGTTVQNINDEETRGAYTIYFARAYVTWLATENLSIDAGRILNYHHRFDVLTSRGGFKYEVGLGTKATYKKGNLKVDASVIHMDDSERMDPSGTPGQEVEYGWSVNYSNIFSKDVKLSYGLAYLGNAKDVGERFHNFMPFFYLNLPMGFYVLNQSLFNDKRGTEFNGYQLYTEVGKEVTDALSVDIYSNSYKIQSATADKFQHDLGLEIYYRFNPAFIVVQTAEMADPLERVKKGRDLKFVTFFELMY